MAALIGLPVVGGSDNLEKSRSRGGSLAVWVGRTTHNIGDSF